jgi:hypothetical protein
MIWISPNCATNSIWIEPWGRRDRKAIQKFLLSVYESEMDIIRLDLTHYARSPRTLVTDLRKTIVRCKLPLHIAQRDRYYVYIFRKELVE